jgi:hypothetical protein
MTKEQHLSEQGRGHLTQYCTSVRSSFTVGPELKDVDKDQMDMSWLAMVLLLSICRRVWSVEISLLNVVDCRVRDPRHFIESSLLTS